MSSFALHDIFSKAKYGDMQAFVQKLRAMGYQQVELIDTTNGMFMSPWEAKWISRAALRCWWEKVKKKNTTSDLHLPQIGGHSIVHNMNQLYFCA